ncbi:MAG: FtsH protease activity modulator HflK [Deferribacteraceae bacterium]|jgi:membrane protease subunit HflK|nr:FtsH protease activity modulator HflK [Deferribacteraceae bacterium]
MIGYNDDFDSDLEAEKPKKREKKVNNYFNGLPKLAFSKAGIVVLVIILIILGKSTFYIVAPSEQAVLKRFGKIVTVVGSGPHFKLPYPIDTVTFAKVTEVHRLSIGYIEKQPKYNATLERSAEVEYISNEPLMLTGDENIVSIDFIVQYQIKDIVQYLYNLQGVTDTIQLAGEASIREIAGKAKIDDLLTIGKEQVQDETRQLIQSILDEYKAGVQIVAVELQDIEPPSEVMNAFRDVASAREDRNRYINEAEAYANQKIPMARAQAATILLEAESYKAVVLSRAEGEASRFTQVYDSYRRTPDITRRRMYLEAMANIVTTSEIFVVDEKSGNLNLFTGLMGELATEAGK